MCDLCANYEDLKLRAQCKKHKKSLPCKAIPLTTSFIKPGNNEAHIIEGCITMFLSCHCTITNCDHMFDFLKHNISNCKAIDDVNMHRAKCTNIITNVPCPHFVKEFTEYIGSNRFSLLLDESNDISIIKLLGVSIIYLSQASVL